MQSLSLFSCPFRKTTLASGFFKLMQSSKNLTYIRFQVGPPQIRDASIAHLQGQTNVMLAVVYRVRKLKNLLQLIQCRCESMVLEYYYFSIFTQEEFLIIYSGCDLLVIEVSLSP